MSERPDYVRCCLTGRGDPPERRTWCGREGAGFAFVDPTHALLHGAAEGRLLLCPGCAAEIAKVLAAMTWDGDQTGSPVTFPAPG
jgi:hypothetical protein